MARRSPEQASVFPGFRDIATDLAGLVEELTSVRLERGLSQTEVAARMGTSQSAVARLESGQSDTRLSTLERYASAIGTELGVTVRHGAGDTQDQDQETSP